MLILIRYKRLFANLRNAFCLLSKKTREMFLNKRKRLLSF